MKKLFLLLLGCLMFGSVFAVGKYDYDSKLVDKWFDKSDDQYFKTPKECNPSAEDYDSYSMFGITTGDLQERCTMNLKNNAAHIKYFSYSGARKDIHNYVSNFVKKYKGKKDIPNKIVTDTIKFSISKFKYGCSFIRQAWGFGITKISEYNRNKYGDYYINQSGEGFINNDPDFPVMDDLSRIGWWLDRLCQYPFSIEFIGKNEKEMTAKIWGTGGPDVTESEKAEIVSGAFADGYLLFETRYKTHPVK